MDTLVFGKRPFRLWHDGSPCNLGFTLLELLVVLAIVTLTLTAIPLYFSGAISAAETRSTTRQLTAALRHTRNTAIIRQTEAVLVLDLSNRRYWNGETNNAETLPADISIIFTTATSEQISDQTGSIRFFPDGSSTGGRIDIRSKRTEFTIEINWLTGGISIQS